MCCTAIENLFHNDPIGEVSFQAVQLIARMVKSKSYNTKPAVRSKINKNYFRWLTPRIVVETVVKCFESIFTPKICSDFSSIFISLPTQVLRTFLHLWLQDVDDPVAATGSVSRHGRKTKEERKKEAKEKLTKKQKKVSLCEY